MGKNGKKTAAKRAGVKSALVVDNKVFVTSFGKGNKGNLDYLITSQNEVQELRKDRSITISSADDKVFEVATSRSDLQKLTALPSNPTRKAESTVKAPRQDMLGLKSVLEKEYFGREFNDNIHIQIIHCIQDIEKILAVYSTNASYALVNLLGNCIKGADSDFIGADVFRMDKSYDSFVFHNTDPDELLKEINQRKAPYYDSFVKMADPKGRANGSAPLGYFGEAFFSEAKKDSGKKKELRNKLRSPSDIYYILSVVSSIRNYCVHYNDGTKYLLYRFDGDNLSKKSREKAEGLRTSLNNIISERFNDISSDFENTNIVDLAILDCVLKKTFSDFTEGSHVQMYYNFVVLKEYKNLGFSIKKLRESMFEMDETVSFKSKDYDTVRSKMNKLIDFFLSYHYTMINKTAGEDLVAALRLTSSDEEKENIYKKEAAVLWDRYKTSFEQIKTDVTPEILNQYKEEVCPSKKYKIQKPNLVGNMTFFSRMMYVLCLFLDGKEINELLTTLINKFDDIQSLMDIATSKQVNVPCKFTSDYSIFNNSSRIVKELNVVKNVARMQKPTASVKTDMLMDALTLLGTDDTMDSEKLRNYVRVQIMKLDAEGKTSKSDDHTLRNFLINNVINSSRFIYVIKYVKADTAYALGHNRKAVAYVLHRIPEQQIDRYYSSCIDRDAGNRTEKENALVDMIVKLSFRDIENVSNDNEKASEKQRYRAVVGLYLTVIYELVKNIVNINSRYVIAFHSLERDAYFYAMTDDKYIKGNGNGRYSAIHIAAEPSNKIDVPEDQIDSLPADLDVSMYPKGGRCRYYYAYTAELYNQEYSSKSRNIAKSKHYRQCVKEDILNARKLHTDDYDTDALREFRNAVAHQDVVRNMSAYIEGIREINSYYGLYHYLAQRCLQKRCNGALDDNTDYFRTLDKYNTYVKDFVKALCVPFAYNAPRFKNLTIEDLFDKNKETEESKVK